MKIGREERRENLVILRKRVAGLSDASLARFVARAGRSVKLRGATNVVVTEYELPHVLLATHDVSGDSKGNIWYSSHRTPFLGKLDPRTGIVTEYQVPTPAPGSGSKGLAGSFTMNSGDQVTPPSAL